MSFQIDDLSILNPELPQDYAGVKGARLDALVRLNSGQFVNVEIQVANQGNIAQRSLFYWARVFGEQLAVGGLYEEIRPVYSVYILDFEWFHGDENYLRNFALRDTASGERFDPKHEYLHFSFIELPKYQETATVPLRSLEKWILFFKTQSDYVLEDLKMSNQTMAKAFSALEIAALSDEERRLYFARMAALSDERSLVSYNLKKGREEGRKEGIEIGIEKNRQEFILNMHRKGMTPEQISGLLDLELELEEVKKILTQP